LEFPQDRFDLVVCNRILQHIPFSSLQGTLGKLCKISRMIYVNELTLNEDLPENFYMARYDYAALFAMRGFRIRQSGLIGNQCYRLFGRIHESSPSEPV